MADSPARPHPHRLATLVVGRMRDNQPFSPGAGPNGGDFFVPWRALRARFEAAGVELNTRDLNEGRDVAFELHLNAQHQVPHPRSYAYLYDDPIDRPVNGDRAALARYRRVWTSNEELLDGDRTRRLDNPNDLTPRPLPGFAARDLFCVLIASRKAMLRPHPRNLHAKRVETIRFFERHAPERFTLYGPGWDIPPVASGVVGRLVERAAEWLRRRRPGPPPFPSWRGKVPRKAAILDRARFSICYENARGSPGHLSEKIFDCLASGCVPVYIGTTHSAQPVPADCYIDGDAFATPAALLAFLAGVDEARFDAYQAAMRRFLDGPDAQRFTNEHWCETLVTGVLADLEAAG